MLLTDGVNNLLAKQMPDFGAVGVAAVPLHVPLPPTTGLNASLALLRWLAYQTGGSAATHLDSPRAFADAVSSAAAQTVRARLRIPCNLCALCALCAICTRCTGCTLCAPAPLHTLPPAHPSAHPSANP